MVSRVTLERDLERSEARIFRTEIRITEQELRIERLRQAGRSTRPSEELLWTFVALLDLYFARRREILRSMALLDGPREALRASRLALLARPEEHPETQHSAR